MGLDRKTWKPDACRQGPVLYSVPCLVILLVFVATVMNMEARKVDLNMQSNHHPPQAMLRHRAQRLRGMQRAKRAVHARATLLLGRGWCKTQNAHEARPRPSFRGQKAVSHVVWTQIPSTVLPPGQMAECENCDSVHWQRQQSSVQVREPETGLKK